MRSAASVLTPTWVWRDDIPTNANGTNISRHRATLDVGAAYRLARHFTLSASARNITDEPYFSMTTVASNAARMFIYQHVGTLWTFDVKGVF